MLKSASVFLAAMSALVCGDLAAPNAGGVAWGHFHFNARDLDVTRKFWTTLGAIPSKAIGANDVYRVQNALVLVRKAEPAGGSEATVVHHVGFRVKDFDAVLARVKDAGYRILTSPEVVAKNHKANIMGPDEINIEIVGDPSMDVPIASHHVHFYSPVEETRDWYAGTFGALPGKRDSFIAADVPGINLTFSAPKGAVKGTKGYAIDHIGFEVKNLEAFSKRLEAAGAKFDRPYTKMPQLGIALAFLTDPWGTYIELTEGLDSVK